VVICLERDAGFTVLVPAHPGSTGQTAAKRARVCVIVCSMFVLLEGRSKDDAFVIGQEIADAVTNDNPKPVKLKLEKVNCFAAAKYR